MKRLLIAGFGDIARRALQDLERRFEVTRLSRSYGFDLDRPASLAIEGADAVLHCAPPPKEGEADPRTANLLAALEKGRILPARFVYVSTTGVYGDCGGARVDESWPLSPRTGRARRRVDAERRLLQWSEFHKIKLVVLRAPGIYAADRLPKPGTPALRAEDDVYTNHIHADDLASSVCRALENDAPAGIYNASDDSEIRLGDWLDLVADFRALPRPSRISREEATRRMSPEVLSFMSESRRLDNRRLKAELGVRLKFPTVHDGLKHEHAPRIDQPA